MCALALKNAPGLLQQAGRATLGISSATRVGHAASGPVRALFAGEGYWCSGGEDGKLMVWQWSGPMPAPPS